MFVLEAEGDATEEPTEAIDEGACTKEIRETFNGTISTNSFLFNVLFDTGASHSFVSLSAVKCLGLTDAQTINVKVKLPSGDSVACSKVFSDVKISINGVEFPARLIAFNLDDLDVILGMDWMSKYEAQIDCRP